MTSLIATTTPTTSSDQLPTYDLAQADRVMVRARNARGELIRRGIGEDVLVDESAGALLVDHATASPPPAYMDALLDENSSSEHGKLANKGKRTTTRRYFTKAYVKHTWRKVTSVTVSPSGPTASPGASNETQRAATSSPSTQPRQRRPKVHGKRTHATGYSQDEFMDDLEFVCFVVIMGVTIALFVCLALGTLFLL